MDPYNTQVKPKVHGYTRVYPKILKSDITQPAFHNMKKASLLAGPALFTGLG